ncbi:MAG: YbhB/YbcL family Raf kinase inhibitor-like protein [Candidatus Berkelbacteria bacterium]|nr:YbhB/YbcL family Raf kinase inhibitor-like protein [Candidatus Berkelbacteria bacterium]MCR4307429.1 YbhB/YbcL family Raf kinase inhibitor-like protein [Candidatus Berkelbacteria bacterium]
MFILLIIVGVSGLAWNNQRRADFETTNKLNSPSFKNNETLPAQFTCDGDNLSPEFTIKDTPKETKSLAFIVEDQDLDKKQFKDLPNPAHLMVWNIPVGTTRFTQGIRPPGTIGRNLFGNFAYGGPCPPEGETHKYSFILYFIEKDSLAITSDAGLAEAKKTIEDNSIGKSKLTASYTRVKK